MPNLLFELLIESAKLYPEKPAVLYRNSEISYRNLDLLSDQLSNCLISRGIQIGDRVGIYIDKSIDAVVAIFSILKTGACYVPLDPMSPPERQAYIINHCTIKYLITSSRKIVQIQHILQMQISLKFIIFMDAAKEEFIQCNTEINIPEVNIVFKDDISRSGLDKLKCNINEDNLAYILYTSGSTGWPKGVMIAHRASLAFIDWAYKYFDINHSERIAAVAPFCFDLSIFDIFVTIKAGATMHIVPSGMCSFPQSLAEFIESEKINTWYSVPSILIQLVLYGELEKRDMSALRRIIFAGEVFSGKYVKKLMQLLSHARFYNLYGPTETNVCTFHPVMNIPESDYALPIGKPCEGTEIFVVDEAGNPVRDGEIGELYVSGPTLMQGYWNDLQKTDETLLKNFLSSSRNNNVYRTGDLVRVNKNGDLEFYGRRDNMIKSRGFRIELEEIESVLLAHPDINEVAVVGVSDEKIGNKIKAVIVLREGIRICESDIKLICSQRLPVYMVPEIVIFKKTLPRTSTNKIDRKHLEMEEP